MIDRERYEIRGKHVDRIMPVHQQDDNAENCRGADTDVTNEDRIPKDERHQKRQTGMAGKEQIATKGYVIQKM